jgi:hypothetical protein
MEAQSNWLGYRCDVAANALTALEVKIDEYVGKSVFALAASLMGEIRDPANEPICQLLRAALSPIRPQLVGAIAEDADRMLAQH